LSSKLSKLSSLTKTEINQLAKAILSDEIILFPTETVYAIGGNAFSMKARKKIYELKGRDKHKPIQLLLANLKDAEKFIDKDKLNPNILLGLRNLWPGPLTAIFPASPLGMIIGEGRTTIGIRIPNHPLALAILKASPCPLVTTSANSSGGPEPVEYDLVPLKLQKAAKRSWIEKGKTWYRMPSTVINVMNYPVTVLRQGALPENEIKKCLKL